MKSRWATRDGATAAAISGAQLSYVAPESRAASRSPRAAAGARTPSAVATQMSARAQRAAHDVPAPVREPPRRASPASTGSARARRRRARDGSRTSRQGSGRRCIGKAARAAAGEALVDRVEAEAPDQAALAEDLVGDPPHRDAIVWRFAGRGRRARRSRSASAMISAQPDRGGSSSYIATGALCRLVHARMSASRGVRRTAR